MSTLNTVDPLTAAVYSVSLCCVAQTLKHSFAPVERLQRPVMPRTDQPPLVV